jgi:hypothetical protein
VNRIGLESLGWLKKKEMKIKRRFPNFFTVDDEDLTEHEVSSFEELVNIDWIKNSIDEGGIVAYSVNNYSASYNHLMMVFDEKTYFVVGYIFGDGKELNLKDYKELIKK